MKNKYWNLPSIIFNLIETILLFLGSYLLKIGLLKRTTRGRMVTEKAYKHLGIPYNNK